MTADPDPATTTHGALHIESGSTCTIACPRHGSAHLHRWIEGGQSRERILPGRRDSDFFGGRIPIGDPDAATTATRPWVVQLTCCGRDNGTYAAATWEEADQFRGSYTSGPGAHAGASGHGDGHYRSAIITGGPADLDAATTAALRNRVAIALHDADCPDRHCDPLVMGVYYRQADVALGAARPLIEAEARAAERQRPLILVWRDERGNEICRSTPLRPGDTKIAIPLDAWRADLLNGSEHV